MSRHPVAYLRRSNASAHNGNGRVSFDVQRAEVLSMAARHGDGEPEMIVEWGVSGAAKSGAFGGTGRGGRRRSYHELRGAIEADRVSALYAYSLSRLARSTRELLDLAELCVSHRVPIRLAKEGDIDGTSASGRLYLTVLAAVSTFEAEVSAERARDRNESMRERGAHLGRAPFGFQIVDGNLVPDPAATPTLRRVLRLYADLKSAAKVARALNDAGVPAPEGATWRDGTIRRVLARQPGYEPPATVRGSRAVPVATFARLLYCHCGATMTPTRKHYRTASGEARTWTGYTCQGARYVRGHVVQKTVPERVILEASRAEAAHLRLPDRVMVETKAAAARAELDARRARIIDALEAGTITRPEAEPRLARITAEGDAIEAESEVLDVPEIEWTWPPERLNPVLRALWERIDLGPDMLPKPDGFAWRVPEWRS